MRRAVGLEHAVDHPQRGRRQGDRREPEQRRRCRPQVDRPRPPRHALAPGGSGTDVARTSPCFIVDARRHGLQIPGEPQPRHRGHHVVGRVELPPVEAVARRALVAVVVVVPAFPHGEERGERVVARVVGRVETAAAPQVIYRVDGKRGVRQSGRGQREAPYQPRPSAEPRRARRRAAAAARCSNARATRSPAPRRSRAPRDWCRAARRGGRRAGTSRRARSRSRSRPDCGDRPRGRRTCGG